MGDRATGAPLDIDSFTDGRLSLEKQTLQNEELK